MNNSSRSFMYKVTSDIGYISFGSIAIVSNLIILYVLLCNVPFFKKSAFIFGLAIGDMLDGTALTIVGALRLAQGVTGTFKMMVHPFYCMKIFVTPILLLGHQIPGVIIFLVGLERFLAVKFFNWYYLKWSNKIAWAMTACAYVFCILSVTTSFFVVYSFSDSMKVKISCSTNEVIGPPYSAYNYTVPISGGLVAAVATLIAMVIFTKKRNRLNISTTVSLQVRSHVKKQWTFTRVTLCLAVVDFGFLVVPNFLLMLSSGFNLPVGDIKAWSTQLVCFRSILNVVIYIFINSEFRIAFLKAFGRNHTVVQDIFGKSTVRVQNKETSFKKVTQS